MKRILFILFGIFFLSNAVFAETTCEKNGCDITITIKLAFAGANDSYINKVKNEIESDWNGPDGFRLMGDCKCKVTFKVMTMKITDPAQINCNPGPPGYHCIMVTNFFKPDGSYDNPPRNQSNITGASISMGYMYGIPKGNGNNSVNGWWSDLMSRPTPGGGNYHDFSHEAGHMFGLDHNNNTNSIMNDTTKLPSNDDVKNAVETVCGPNPCPDACCCGNGKVDKGEGCDPLAQPNGCKGQQACCPVCCKCFMPICIASSGEYTTFSTCQRACGVGAFCYQNYKTGCWDCVKQNIVVHNCANSTKVRGNLECDHISFVERSTIALQHLVNTPIIGSALANDKINIQTTEGDKMHIATSNGRVLKVEEGLDKNSTLIIRTDQETISLLAANELSLKTAFNTGKISIESDDLLTGIKLWCYKLVYGVYSFFSSDT